METRKSRHQNNSKKVVRNLKERNRDKNEKSPKQVLNSATVLIVMLSEGIITKTHSYDWHEIRHRTVKTCIYMKSLLIDSQNTSISEE